MRIPRFADVHCSHAHEGDRNAPFRAYRSFSHAFALLPMSKRPLVESVAVVTATTAAAATATGVVALARGDTRGAPGVTKALARIGRTVGGSMLTGIALASGAGALTGLALYAGIRRASRPFV